MRDVWARQKTLKIAHFTTCKHVWFAQSWPCSFPGPRRWPGVIPECSSHTSSSLRRRGPSPPVWHLGHEEEMSKGSRGLSQLGEKTPVSSWELGLDPT